MLVVEAIGRHANPVKGIDLKVEITVDNSDYVNFSVDDRDNSSFWVKFSIPKEKMLKLLKG